MNNLTRHDAMFYYKQTTNKAD
jgi:hypothetical protein